MNLYRISQDENDDYDTYDVAIVAAESEQSARETHPGDPGGERSPWTMPGPMETWCSSPSAVIVDLVGVALAGTKAGVICASFNAG